MSSSTGLNPKTETVLQTSSSSQSRLIHFSHTWTIDNFSHRFDSSSKSNLQSSDISFSPDDKQTFALRMYPDGKTENSSGYLSLFLWNSYKHSCDPVVGCKFALLNDKRTKCNLKEIQKKLYAYSNYQLKDDQKEIGFEKYISRNEISLPSNGFLPDNKLTIYVEISYLTGEKNTLNSYNLAFIESAGENSALEDYANLLKSGDLSDVVLLVSGREFRAHKAFLASRSPVFLAMFKHDLMEKQKNRVEITDVKVEVFEQLLTYIYSGKVDSIERNAEDLLAAADKYQLMVLKSHCERYLCTNVSVLTAPNLLMLADSYNADKLKTNVLDFMKRQSNETIQAIIKANPDLLVEMFRFLANKSEQLEK